MAQTNGSTASTSKPPPARKKLSKRSLRNKKKNLKKKLQKEQKNQQSTDNKEPSSSSSSSSSNAETSHSTSPSSTNTRRRSSRFDRATSDSDSSSSSSSSSTDAVKDEVEIEYTVSDDLRQVDEGVASQFAEVFARFGKSSSDVQDSASGSASQLATEEEEEARTLEGTDERDATENGAKPAPKKITRKQRKELQRLKVAVLKQSVATPDVVTIEDVTAADPALLVHLKGTENTVPVPRHWSQKRKYLQNKQGGEQSPFTLPKFIADTGIGGMRESYREKEDAKTAKALQRDRMAPKMGKMEINYQTLHDAFFVYQTKPKMTTHGDMYYENKEFEMKVPTNLVPGVLSRSLRAALDMTENGPPPYLTAMQRYGPPPAYPHLKIPGLNAPIPAGESFGFQAGGWGKPPVDAQGNPIYGNVFDEAARPQAADAPVDRQLWGELEIEEYESSDDEEESSDDEDSDEEDATAGSGEAYDPMAMDGIVSVTTGLVTPDVMPTVRKLRGFPENSMAQDRPKELYQVLEEKQTNVDNTQMYGSAHTYVLPGAHIAADTSSEVPRPPDDVAELSAEENRKRKRAASQSKEREKKYKF